MESSGTIYSHAGSWDLFFIFGYLISNFVCLFLLYVLVFTENSVDTITFAQLNMPSLSVKTPPPPPLNVLEINKPNGGLNRGFAVVSSFFFSQINSPCGDGDDKEN